LSVSEKRSYHDIIKRLLFSGFLQDLEVVTDKDDSRCLHVTVHSPTSSSATSSKRLPLLSATFTFDDHIRCMAAKQRQVTNGPRQLAARKRSYVVEAGEERREEERPYRIKWGSKFHFLAIRDER